MISVLLVVNKINTYEEINRIVQISQISQVCIYNLCCMKMLSKPGRIKRMEPKQVRETKFWSKTFGWSGRDFHIKSTSGGMVGKL